jgi:hypothetical protein
MHGHLDIQFVINYPLLMAPLFRGFVGLKLALAQRRACYHVGIVFLCFCYSVAYKCLKFGFFIKSRIKYNCSFHLLLYPFSVITFHMNFMVYLHFRKSFMSLYWKQTSIVWNFVSQVLVFDKYTTIRYLHYLIAFSIYKDTMMKSLSLSLKKVSVLLETWSLFGLIYSSFIYRHKFCETFSKNL